MKLCEIIFFALLITVISGREGWAGTKILADPSVASTSFVDKGYTDIPVRIAVEENGKPLQGVKVRLVIASADNHSAAMPVEQKSGISGLSWLEPAPGGLNARTEIILETDSRGHAETVLTDIIGDRSVIIEAKLEGRAGTGVAHSKIMIGKGPLSLFASAPDEPLSWFALYRECNGSDYPGDPVKWNPGAEFAGGEKMPSLD